jgi:hypothetical protein
MADDSYLKGHVMATPKSIIFMDLISSSVPKTLFSGFKSRWIIPNWFKYSTPCAIIFIILAAIRSKFFSWFLVLPYI